MRVCKPPKRKRGGGREGSKYERASVHISQKRRERERGLLASSYISHLLRIVMQVGRRRKRRRRRPLRFFFGLLLLGKFAESFYLYLSAPKFLHLQVEEWWCYVDCKLQSSIKGKVL